MPTDYYEEENYRGYVMRIYTIYLIIFLVALTNQNDQILKNVTYQKRKK